MLSGIKRAISPKSEEQLELDVGVGGCLPVIDLTQENGADILKGMRSGPNIAPVQDSGFTMATKLQSMFCVKRLRGQVMQRPRS
jgi:hypothetical protein